jgi:hypothetical protein
MRISIAIIVLCCLVACSSLKQPTHPQAKYDADSHFALAQEQEAGGDVTAATKSYSYASELYSSFGSVEGKLSCMTGLARLALQEGNATEYSKAINEMNKLVADTDQSLDYHLLLLKLYEHQTRKDFTGMSATAELKAYYPLHAKLQISTIKLQANSYLGLSSADLAKELLKYCNEYRKQMKKLSWHNTALVSSAWYAVAYHYYLNKDYLNADKYIRDACEWDYRYANYNGLGHGYWLMGQIQAKSNEISAALSNLRKAEIIFEALQDGAAYEAVKGEIARLKGETP